MTFQTTLVGTDGLTAASDRRIAIRTGQSTSKGDWQYTTGDKFLKRDDESLICFYAGGPRSKSIARVIVARANPLETHWDGSLIEIADSCPAEYSSGDEVLVIRKHVPDVILLSTGRIGTGAEALKIEDRMCTGVPVTARFLTQHFWKPAPVATLKRLLLLTLDYAARESPGSIGHGFDVVSIVGSNARWERYSPTDERIIAVRQSFNPTVHALIYPNNSPIDHT